ncbi:inner membrane domain protein [Burkholderia ambifaria AMMD]|nr:inner membrane domain protein [Burkholderia ambifaria AMMD]
MKIVAKALMKLGVLMPRSDGYPYRQEYIPGHGKFMVYRVLPSIFTHDCERRRRRPVGRWRAFLCVAFLARASKLL